MPQSAWHMVCALFSAGGFGLMDVPQAVYGWIEVLERRVGSLRVMSGAADMVTQVVDMCMPLLVVPFLKCSVFLSHARA